MASISIMVIVIIEINYSIILKKPYAWQPILIAHFLHCSEMFPKTSRNFIAKYLVSYYIRSKL